MRLINFVGATVLLIVPVCATTLTMDVLPDEEGWFHYAEGQNRRSVSNGILTIGTTEFHEYTAPSSEWNDIVSNSRSWYVETRTRLVKGDPSSGRLGGIGLWIHAEYQITVLHIASDGVYITVEWESPIFLPLDTSEFHVYRVSGHLKNIQLSVDSVPVLSLQCGPCLDGTHGFIFGDMAGGTPTLSEWDYVTLETNPIPEPTTSLLVAFGLGCIALRATRRGPSLRKTRSASHRGDQA